MQPTPAGPPNPVFNESNVGEALKLAKEKNQPIISFTTADGRLDHAAKAAMKANESNAVFVVINQSQSGPMMDRGMDTNTFWQLANLAGARSDVNNIRPGFVGKFNASDFDPANPKYSLKPVKAGSLEEVMAGQIQPPAPQDGSKPVQPKPSDKPVPQPDAKKEVRPPEQKKEVPPPPEAKKDVPPEQGDKAKPKLEQVKFSTEELAKAIQAAKDNNLPLVVYKGADYCRYCPTVSAAVDNLAKGLKDTGAPQAVVVKLNHEERVKLRSSDPELAKQVDALMNQSSVFPHVSVFNPNDMSRAITGGGYGGDANYLRSLVQSGRNAMPGEKPSSSDTKVVPPQPVKPQDKPTVKPQDKPTVKPEGAKVSDKPNQAFNEANVLDAIKLAKEKNLPIVSVATPDGKLDAAAQNAVKGAGDNAVVVVINDRNADSMMRRGMDPAKFWALSNLRGSNGDVNNIKPGFVGRFNPSEINTSDTNRGFKAAKSGSLSDVLQDQVQPPAPRPQDRSVQPPAKPTEPPRPETPPAKPSEKPGMEPRKEVPPPAEQGEKKPVKLDKVKFDTNDVEKAFQIAKDNNLPVIIYKGADFCGNCPPVSAAVDRLAENLKKAPTTEAVVVKLNWEQHQRLKTSNPDLAKYIDQFLPNGTGYPDVKVYNPNDTSKPLKDENRYGGEDATLRGLVEIGRKAMPAPKAPEKPPEKPPEVKPEVKPELKPEVKPENAPPKLDPNVVPADLIVDPFDPKVQKASNTEVAPPPSLPKSVGPKPEEKQEPKPEEKKEPQPEAPPKAPEKLDKPLEKTEGGNNNFKVKTAVEAKAAIDEARKRNLPLIVHSPTVICTDQTCTMTNLDSGTAERFKDKAVFLELPRGGVKDIPEGAQFDELRKLNDQHKVTDDDHKTELDMHVYSFNATSKALEQKDGTKPKSEFLQIKSKLDASKYISSRIEAIKAGK